VSQESDIPSDRGDHAAIRTHIEKHLGPVSRVLGTSTATGISILLVASHETRPVHTLITLGLSDHAMNTPLSKNAPRYIELMVTLPRTWKLDAASLNDARWNWPLRQLASIADLPSTQSTWLGWGEVIPNGDPPRPLAPSTKLSGAVIVPSLLVPQDFYELKIAAHSIAFFCLLPLYQEEMGLQRAKGVNHLFETLVDAGVKDFIDPRRRNVAKKRFGFF
jgi:Suppressor of fused protein (SUFU)